MCTHALLTYLRVANSSQQKNFAKYYVSYFQIFYMLLHNQMQYTIKTTLQTENETHVNFKSIILQCFLHANKVFTRTLI